MTVYKDRAMKLIVDSFLKLICYEQNKRPLNKPLGHDKSTSVSSGT